MIENLGLSVILADIRRKSVRFLPDNFCKIRTLTRLPALPSLPLHLETAVLKIILESKES